MKRKTRGFFIFAAAFIVIELFCRFCTEKEYFLGYAYYEYSKVNEDMVIFKTQDFIIDRVFAVDKWGTVRAFNVMVGSDIRNADQMNIYQCRKWQLSPIELIYAKYCIYKINAKDESVMQYCYGSAGSFYMLKNGREYTVGSLSEVFNLSDEGKKYATAWSRLIKAFARQELNRYNAPMDNDEAWYCIRVIDKRGNFVKKKYFEGDSVKSNISFE